MTADAARERSPLDGVDLEALLREVLARVHHGLDEQARLRLLLDAVASMGADLSLTEVLARIVQIARELVDARYAALGVLDTARGTGLREFVHDGMDPALVEEIGALPTGHGLLGLLIDRPEPLRLSHIAAHPDSYGFPPGHPAMASFIGVPIRIGERVFGNLYVTEKVGEGDFTPEDEDVIIGLASAAGVAIENARLHEEAGRREDWLAATAEISGLLSGAGAVEEALQVVADRARGVAGADVTWIVVGTGDGLDLRAVSGAEVSPDELPGLHGLAGDGSPTHRVVASGQPLVVPDLAAEGGAEGPDGAGLTVVGWPTLGPAIVVPLSARGVVVGALALAWTPAHADAFHEVDAGLPASFAEQAALALEVVRSRDSEQRLAVLEDRDRIGRDLHDLVIQRLFAVGLSLQSVSRTVGDDAVVERLEAAVQNLDATIKDIRRSIFELSFTSEAADLQTEVTRLVDRAASMLKFRPVLRLSGPVRTRVGDDVSPHLLAVLGEALSNASRHAEATTVEVDLSVTDDLRLVVSDNGHGMPDDVRESGLRHLRQRALQLGGTCDIASSPRGTTITWVVPLS